MSPLRDINMLHLFSEVICSKYKTYAVKREFSFIRRTWQQRGAEAHSNGLHEGALLPSTGPETNKTK